jgi:hypothetical protein|tara:strand:+ start:804 stop:950 length:147 start_codon:yes stop_codon:yes gene_type:complete
MDDVRTRPTTDEKAGVAFDDDAGADVRERVQRREHGAEEETLSTARAL